MSFSEGLAIAASPAIEPEPTLIVAHAQHPLLEGTKPGPEFAARLDLAAEIYGGIAESDVAVGALDRIRIYVPGSRHRVGSNHDKLSLSDAGEEYLVARKGIPEDVVVGEKWNEKYKGGRGVYNGGDEAHVAVNGFLDEELEQLIAVCTPTQQTRLSIHYAAHGAVPDFRTAEAETDFHGGLVGGLAERILTGYTRNINASWQRGVLPRLIRATRVPIDGFGIGSIPR